MSVGLSQIVAPMLLLALFYIGYRFVRGTAPIRFLPVWYGPSETPWRTRLSVIAISLAGGVILAAPGFLAWLFTRPGHWPIVFMFIGVLTSSLVVLVVVHVRDVLIRRYRGSDSFNSLRIIGLFALLWALTLFPGCVLFGSAIGMQPVRVCGAASAYNLPGFLIGETNDRVYVGEQREDGRSLAIPWDNTEAVFIGSPNIPELCERVRPDASVVPPTTSP